MNIAVAALVVGCSQNAPERPPFAELSCEGSHCEPRGGGVAVGTPPTPGSGNDTPSDAETNESDGNTTGTGEASTGPASSSEDSVLLDPQEANDLMRTAGASIGRPYALYQWPNLEAPLWKSTGLGAESVPVNREGEWLLVLITDAAEALDPAWLPTLTWQHPSIDPVIVPVFRVQFWSDLAAGLALAPTTLDPEASHVLVKVVDPTGQPLLGVSAEVVSGAVAYGNGGSATDVLTETDDSGVLIWINAPVGDGTTLTLRTDADMWSVVLPTRAASVTVAAVAH